MGRLGWLQEAPGGIRRLQEAPGGSEEKKVDTPLQQNANDALFSKFYEGFLRVGVTKY